jgi:hypothetical protein
MVKYLPPPFVSLQIDRASVRVPTDYERKQNWTDSAERRGAVSRGNWHTLYAS